MFGLKLQIVFLTTVVLSCLVRNSVQFQILITSEEKLIGETTTSTSTSTTGLKTGVAGDEEEIIINSTVTPSVLESILDEEEDEENRRNFEKENGKTDFGNLNVTDKNSPLNLPSANNILGENERDFKIQEKDLTEELERWEAPIYIQRNYPYYLSGYDLEEGRPIWVMEFGKMDLRHLVEVGGSLLADFEKYTEQISYKLIKSIKAAGVSEAIFLLDFEGLQITQLAHPPTIAFGLKLVFKNRDLIQHYLGPTIFVNANFVAESAINLVRPALGRAFQKVEIYGSNKQKWIPHIRRLLGASQIAPWYGGNKDFKPVAVYG